MGILRQDDGDDALECGPGGCVHAHLRHDARDGQAADGAGGQEVAQAGAFGSTAGTDILTSMSLSALALKDGAVTVSWSFQAPVAAVWRGLTDPALLSQWLGTVIEIDIRAGGSLVIDHGQGQLSRSAVTEAEAPHRLTMTWEFPDEPRSQVTVELRESDEGAAAKLTHTGPDLAASYGAGWTTHLTYLEAAVQGETIPPSQFWKLYATFAALRDERASIP
jgi:uncharacterized protein YndB with AHSA1/START domain